MKGFFSSSSWALQRRPLQMAPLCGQCGLHQHCASPKMPVAGKGKRKVLILAEAPGEQEDARGEPLVGAAGAELSRLCLKLGIHMRRDCWLDNAIICRPTEDGQNRTPTTEEVDNCRPHVAKTVHDLQPEVIIACGATAVKSLLPLAWTDKPDLGDNFTKWVGWTIPSQRLNTWICPTYHPSFLLREKEKNAAVELHILRHLATAFSLDSRPWEEHPAYANRVVVVFDDVEAARVIKQLMDSGKPLAFDYETDRLKPDHPDAAILCCAVSDGEVSVAYPWIGKAITATKELLLSPVPKIASNMRFEERWTRRKLGIAVRNWHHDTVLAAHWLDCRHGICGLKFQAFVLLGQPDYSSHLEEYMKAADSNSPNRLREVEPRQLLHYCGLDALLEVLVAEKQRELYYGR